MNLEELLKGDFVSVVNSRRSGIAPEWTDEPRVRYEDINDYQFDVVDPKGEHDGLKRPFKSGTASYTNGIPENTYDLRFVCYEDYLNQFVFDDGQGNKTRSMLMNLQRADLLVYDRSEGKKYFIVHELCKGSLTNKRSESRKQLGATLNFLCKSSTIKDYINSFENKICIVSAQEEKVSTPQQIAEGFMNVYEIVQEASPFTYQPIKKWGFVAFETRDVVLE